MTCSEVDENKVVKAKDEVDHEVAVSIKQHGEESNAELAPNKKSELENELLDAICRICLCGGSSQEEAMISPCNCKGSQKFVHSECLEYWQIAMIKLNNFNRARSCVVCSSTYSHLPVRQYSTSLFSNLTTYLREHDYTDNLLFFCFVLLFGFFIGLVISGITAVAFAIANQLLSLSISNMLLLAVTLFICTNYVAKADSSRRSLSSSNSSYQPSYYSGYNNARIHRAVRDHPNPAIVAPDPATVNTIPSAATSNNL